MVLNIQLSKSKEWIQKSRTLLHGASFETSAKSKLSMSLFHLSLEHEHGMCSLAEKGLYGSALSLFRPQFEAHVRGIWVYLCATDNQLKKFLAGEWAPTLHEAIKLIERAEGQEEGPLRVMKKVLGKDLNDFTHGGAIQAIARSPIDQVASKYDMEQVESVLLVSSVLSFRTCLEISKVVGDAALEQRLVASYIEIWPDAP